MPARSGIAAGISGLDLAQQGASTDEGATAGAAASAVQQALRTAAAAAPTAPPAADAAAGEAQQRVAPHDRAQRATAGGAHEAFAAHASGATPSAAPGTATAQRSDAAQAHGAPLQLARQHDAAPHSVPQTGAEDEAQGARARKKGKKRRSHELDHTGALSLDRVSGPSDQQPGFDGFRELSAQIAGPSDGSVPTLEQSVKKSKKTKAKAAR